MIITSQTIDESPRSFIVAPIKQRSFIDGLFRIVVKALENLTSANSAREMLDFIALETFPSEITRAFRKIVIVLMLIYQ